MYGVLFESTVKCDMEDNSLFFFLNITPSLEQSLRAFDTLANF